MKLTKLFGSVVLVPFLYAACGGVSSPKGGTATCVETQACIQGCTSANINTCVPACIAQLSTAAKPYVDALEACSQPACVTAPDGGTAPCESTRSTTCTSCVTTNCGAQEGACLNN